MNRHDRRKAVKLGRTSEILTGGAAAEAMKDLRGSMCKWSGCGETFPSGPLPKGWRFLIMHHNPVPIAADKWDHDACALPGARRRSRWSPQRPVHAAGDHGAGWASLRRAQTWRGKQRSQSCRSFAASTRG